MGTVIKDLIDMPHMHTASLPLHGTTILCVKNNHQVALGGDGQVSLGPTVMKGNAKKVRRLFHGKVLAGFAGSTADAFTLFDLFDKKLEKHQGHLLRAAVELAKDWRGDRILRRLEAMLIVASQQHAFVISGNGDVIEPEEGVVAIGSGGMFARSAALALVRETALPPVEIVEKSLHIAAAICVYTNHHLTIESIDMDKETEPE